MANTNRPDPGCGPRRPLVIVVDDDPEVLRSLERILRREPYELLTTLHPADVLQWICERRVDLILADQRMPEMDGTALLEVVCDYSPETACLILSGFPDTALLVEQARLRIERLIAKPWDTGELTGTIRRVLEERASREIGKRPSSSEAPAVPVTSPAGLEVVIDCAGRRARDVIAEILPVCSRAQAGGDQPTIVLGNVRLLEDSVARLLKGLARAVAWSHFPIDLRDDSGCVAAFLSAVSHATPVRK